MEDIIMRIFQWINQKKKSNYFCVKEMQRDLHSQVMDMTDV